MTEIVLGAITILLFGVHVTGGEREVARPMLAADYDATARWTMYVCWHAISAHLLIGGITLVWAGLNEGVAADVLVAAISTLHLVYAALFLLFAARSRIERGWLKLGQWIAFLPLGVIGWWAVIA